MTPGAVSVERSKEDIVIHCTKPGWQDGFASIPSNFEGWTVGNLLLSGVRLVNHIGEAKGGFNLYPPNNPDVLPAPGVGNMVEIVEFPEPERWYAGLTPDEREFAESLLRV